MISFNETEIAQLALHYVGNKYNEEQVLTSKSTLSINLEVEQALTHLFLNHFEEAECFELYHEDGVENNLIWQSAKCIFSDDNSLYLESIKLANHLFENSNHPKIKGGEFYTVLFKNCHLDGYTVDAIGLFKTENKDTFIKIEEHSDGFVLDSQEGIHIDKLDKGCLIYNQNEADGYKVSVVDRTNKADARFWIDDFLRLKQEKDAFFHTEKAVELAHSFIANELPNQYETSKVDQADLMNRSASYMKEQEHFDLEEFSHEVMGQAEVIDSFKAYSQSFENENDVDFSQGFDISDQAVKKKSRVFKSVIKLDKNFHIYVHGNRDMIEQGVDENGRKFYTLYYNEEK